jgi:hypothetical protein
MGFGELVEGQVDRHISMAFFVDAAVQVSHDKVGPVGTHQWQLARLRKRYPTEMRVASLADIIVEHSVKDLLKVGD